MTTIDPADTTRRVLVLGGTGFVGQSLCERLVRAGWTVRVPTRRLRHAQALQVLPTVELIEADVHDPAALKRLLTSCDAVVNLVAILHGSLQAFERVHLTLPQALAAACTAAGVRRLVHVSALGVGPDAPSNYLRSKTAGEAALQSAGLDLTLIRPSVIFGANDRFLNLFAQLQAVAPVMPLAGADARFQPVWVEDVAEAIVQALARRDSIGQIYEAAGPDVCTLADLVRMAGRWAGHARPVIALPAAAGRLQAAVMSLMPGEPMMSADNLDSMRVPNVATGQLPGLQSLGVEPAALAAVAPLYLGQRPGRTRFNRFRSHARRG
jgi:NADH dehydrogenase